MMAALSLYLISSVHGAPPTLNVTGPCDIYARGNSPCVAADSLTRALYGAYDGSLYNVKRSDGTTQDIFVTSAGGFADITAQDKFCETGSCVVQKIYDQSPMQNHLGICLLYTSDAADE